MGRGGRRWEQLFADLDAEFEAGLQAELDAEIAERARAELNRIGLLDRLRAATGRPVTVTVDGAGTVVATVHRVGAGWAVLDAGGVDVLLNATAIVSVAGLAATGAQSLPDVGVDSRLGLGFVLRGLARDRSPIVVRLRDGTALGGTLERVGADAVDIAEHRSGEPYPGGGRGPVRSVPFAAISLVRIGS
jgi:hypothetical protein